MQQIGGRLISHGLSRSLSSSSPILTHPNQDWPCGVTIIDQNYYQPLSTITTHYETVIDHYLSLFYNEMTYYDPFLNRSNYYPFLATIIILPLFINKYLIQFKRRLPQPTAVVSDGWTTGAWRMMLEPSWNQQAGELAVCLVELVNDGQPSWPIMVDCGGSSMVSWEWSCS